MDIIILLVVVVISLVLFYGGIAYLIGKFLRSDSGMPKEQKYTLLARLFKFSSSRGGGSRDPMDTKAGGAAADAGFDLNDNR